MSQSSDQMELREEDIRKHYTPAAEMLMQLDHSPRLAQARLSLEQPEKSPGVSETLCMRVSPCEFGGSFVEPFWV